MGMTLKTDGKLEIHKKKIVAYTWEPEKQRWEKELTFSSKSFIPLFFDYKVEFVGDVTMSDFMKYIIKHDDILSMTFASYMSADSLKPFFKQMSKRSRKTFNNVGFFWNAISFGGHLELDGSFYGVTQDMSRNMITRHDLDLVQISNYRDAKIEIFIDFLIEEIISDEEGEVIDSEIVFTGQRMWSFYDLLSTFLRELTALGNPEYKQSVIDDFKKNLEKHRNSKEHKEEMLNSQMNELKSKLKIATEKEEYESASEIKKEIDNLQKMKDRLHLKNRKKENGFKQNK
jgi:hypothetical protein